MYKITIVRIKKTTYCKMHKISTLQIKKMHVVKCTKYLHSESKHE